MWLNEIFTKSFASIKSNYSTWLLVGLIFTVLGIPSFIIGETAPIASDTVNFDFNALTSYLKDTRPTGALLYLSLLSNLIYMLIVPGLLAVALMGARGQYGKLGLIVDKASLVVKFIGFFILYMILITLGTVALIIPGIYLLLRYSMTPFILIDKGNIGVFDAMKESSDMMKGNYWKVFFNQFVLWIAVIVTTIVALLVTLPFSFIFSADSLATSIIIQIVGIFVISITYPLWGVGSAVVYTEVLKGKGSKSPEVSK